MASKGLKEAKARLAALRATIAAAAVADKAADNAVKPIRAKLEALHKRLERMVVVTTAGGGHRLTTLAEMQLGYLGGTQFSSEKVLRDAIAKGEQKVQLGYGVTMTIRGLSQRVHFPAKEAVRLYQQRVRATDRATVALQKAQAAQNAALEAAFESGRKSDPDELAKFVARAYALREAARPVLDHEVQQKASDARRFLADAEQHLAWIKATNPDKDVCPCQRCQAERAAAIRRKALVERIANLPSAIRTCDQHGRKRMKLERLEGRQWFGDRYIDNPPVAYCPVGPHGFLDNVTVEADKAKAERAAARAAARAPRLNWVCPNPDCGEISAYLPTNGSVTCEACDVELDANVVKTVKPERKAA